MVLGIIIIIILVELFVGSWTLVVVQVQEHVVIVEIKIPSAFDKHLGWDSLWVRGTIEIKLHLIVQRGSR